ncbi:MAG: cofilin [Pycnora praestabilis]|nr:MAG: cofilin [Pycnora praestabilis]
MVSRVLYEVVSSLIALPVRITGTTKEEQTPALQATISTFNELKLGKSIKYIIYKLSDDYKEVVLEETSSDPDYEVFYQKLRDAKSKDKRGKEGPGPRYAVYDFEYELEGGEGKRSKIAFIAWSPDDALTFPKMTYASSKEALKRSLNGIALDIQRNDASDIEYESMLKVIKQGRF